VLGWFVQCGNPGHEKCAMPEAYGVLI